MNLIKRSFLISTILCIIISFPEFNYAEYSIETDFNLQNEEVLYLELSSTSIDLGEIKPDMKELVKLNLITAKIKSNVKWILTVEPLDNLISTSGDIISIEKVQIRTNKDDFVPLSLTKPVVIGTGGKTKDEGQILSLDFKIKINWDDPAGIYNTKLRFTLNSIY